MKAGSLIVGDVYEVTVSSSGSRFTFRGEYVG